MIHTLLTRWRQGHRTLAYPKTLPALPERFRGRPEIRAGACPDDCQVCAGACPTGAIVLKPEGPAIDLGRCLFCLDCTEAGSATPATTGWPPAPPRTCCRGRGRPRAWPRPWTRRCCGSWAAPSSCGW